jgi:hypothetical protein
MDWPTLMPSDRLGPEDGGDLILTQEALDARIARLPPHPVTPSPVQEGDVVRVTIHVERGEERLKLSPLHCTVNGTRVGKGFREHGEGVYSVEYVATAPAWSPGGPEIDKKNLLPPD